MKTFSYNDSAGQLTEILDYVEAHREETMITRAGHESIVVLPFSEYESLRETMYLMNSIARLEQYIHKAGAVSSSRSA